MNKKILYHGSPEIVKMPLLEKGKPYNDYGQGFYCTENVELAKEWACSEGVDGYVNQYEIEMSDLNILNLSDEKYSILHWLTLLITYRQFRISTPLMKRGVEWLKENYYIDIRKYDVIVGYRADDSYFSFARAFLNNEISINQLSYAMRLGKLGEQFAIKSAKAFSNIKYIKYLAVDSTEYYPRRKSRDEVAREKYLKELEKEETNGVYIRDLINREVKNDSSI